MAEEGRHTILIVEDVEGYRLVYRDILHAEGYTVLEAANGKEGLKMAFNRRPNLILLDLVMPELDGYQFLEQIRADPRGRTVPIIVLSVLNHQENIKKCLALGANDYAIKGMVAPSDLLRQIRSFVSNGDIRKNVQTCRIALKDDWADAAKLKDGVGLPSLFKCPDCSKSILLELMPDYTHTCGHWFSAHLVCQGCGKVF